MAKRINTQPQQPKPTTAFMEFKLTVDGGDVQDPVTQRIRNAVVKAFSKVAGQVRLHYTFAVETRSVSPAALQKRLARRGAR